MKLAGGLSIILLLIFLIASMSFATDKESTIPKDKQLRVLAEKRGFLIGYASVNNFWTELDIYQQIAKDEFNILTPENQMKWDAIHPLRNEYDFEPADRHVDFAQKNGMKVHGHTLVWHNQLPVWLLSHEWSSKELTDILYDHIDKVCGHFAGKILVWDVVNEAFEDNGSYRKTLWYDTLGSNYIEMAFARAQKADPGAKLIYNDYNIETVNPKSTAVYDMIRDLKKKGVPVDGVGFQMHIDGSGLNYQSFAENMARFAALGLQIYITEMDVRLTLPTLKKDLADQAEIYRNVLKTCLDQPACKALQVWGLTDRYSWVPGFFTGQGDALLFNDNFQPKPAFFAIQETLQ